MPTLDLKAPGASPSEISSGLAAAGDVTRVSGMAAEFVHAGWLLVLEHRAGRHVLDASSWHWRAAEVFEAAQAAALGACFGDRQPPVGSQLLMVKGVGPASFLD